MIVKDVKHLEKAYEVELGDEKRFKIQLENIPSSFHILIPYLEYYCIADQNKREDFYDALPEQASKDLNEVIETIEPQLTYWLGSEDAQKNMGIEYYALSILSDLNDCYVARLQGEEWRGKIREFSQPDKTRVNQLLKLDEKELKTIWGIADDKFKRITFEVSKLPENLKVLKHILSLFAIEDDDEFWSFHRQLQDIAMKDMELVKLSMDESIRDFTLVFKDEYTLEELAVMRVINV